MNAGTITATVRVNRSDIRKLKRRCRKVVKALKKLDKTEIRWDVS